MKQIIILAALLLAAFIAIGQNGKVIKSTGGGTGGWLKDSLSAGDVEINALTNSLLISDMDSTHFQANNGISFQTPDIWFSQMSPWTKLNAGNNFTMEGGIMNFNSIAGGSIGISSGPVSVSISDITDLFAVNGSFRVNTNGHAILHNTTPAAYSSYGATEEGAIVYNSTDNAPMFWDGASWVTMADAASVPSAPSAGYAEMTVTSSQSLSTTFTKFNTTVTGDVSAGWTFSAGTDDLSYSGSTAKYLLQFSASADLPTQSFNELTIVVRQEGTETTAKAKASAGNTGVQMGFSGSAIVTVASGDSFDIGGYLQSGTGNIDLDYCQVVLTKLVGQ